MVKIWMGQYFVAKYRVSHDNVKKYNVQLWVYILHFILPDFNVFQALPSQDETIYLVILDKITLRLNLIFNW